MKKGFAKKLGSLKDVSIKANVHVSTVSRYLSNKLKVKPETEQRILAAIESTGYQPNYIARALRNNMTLNIGVIAPSGSNPLFAEIISGIGTVLSEESYTYFLITSDNCEQRELSGIHTLQSKLVDGIIILNTKVSNATFTSWLDSGIIKNQPFVFVNSMFESDQFSRVLCNFWRGSYDATEYLIKNGRRKIAMITGFMGHEESDIKQEGYAQALIDAELPANMHMVLPGAYRYVEGYEAAEYLIKTFQPDAIFCANDLMAIATMRCATKLGLNIPTDIAVIGYGNSETSGFVTPMLSTVDQQKALSGKKAAQLVLEEIRTGDKRTVHVDTSLLVRETC